MSLSGNRVKQKIIDAPLQVALRRGEAVMEPTYIRVPTGRRKKQ